MGMGRGRDTMFDYSTTRVLLFFQIYYFLIRVVNGYNLLAQIGYVPRAQQKKDAKMN